MNMNTKKLLPWPGVAKRRKFLPWPGVAKRRKFLPWPGVAKRSLLCALCASASLRATSFAGSGFPNGLTIGSGSNAVTLTSTGAGLAANGSPIGSGSATALASGATGPADNLTVAGTTLGLWAFNWGTPTMPENPADLESCILYLDGDAASGTNGNPITAWNDSSTAENNAVLPAAPPVLITGDLNGHNAVQFDGSTEYLSLPFEFETGPFTVIEVVKFNSAPFYGSLLAGPNESSIALSTGENVTTPALGEVGYQTLPYSDLTPSTGSYYVVAFTSAGISGTSISANAFLDGIGSASNPVAMTDISGGGFSTGTTCTIGADRSGARPNLPANIAAVAIFNTVLSSYDLAAVTIFFNQRFNLP